MHDLFRPITTLQHVAQKRAALYAKLDITTPYDLLYHFPRHYLDYRHPVSIAEAKNQSIAVLRVRILQKLSPQFVRNGLTVFKAIAEDATGQITIVTYNTPYAINALVIGAEYCMSGKIGGNLFRKDIYSPHIIPAESKEQIRPVYPLTTGLTTNMVENNVRQALTLLQEAPFEWMPGAILTQYQLPLLVDALPAMHFPHTLEEMEQARRRLAFDELLQLQIGMRMLRRRSQKETALQMQAVEMQPFYQALPFSLTAGQQAAVSEITQDLCRNVPMNRLLQGDVGSGKTAVAAAACYFAAKNGMQSALMAPTEILAGQHYATLQKMLEPLGISVGLLTGSMRTKEKNAVRAAIADGTCMVLVGTHAIFQKTVAFANLALVITDEQHRFGVEQRSQLAEKGNCPHKLVMSATPIPRTLALMIYGDLDISILKELPSGRKPVETYAVTGRLRQRAYHFIEKELVQGRQAYIVCPMIEEGEQDLQAVAKYAEQIQNGAFAAYRVGLLHGKMKAAEKETVMRAFRDRELDLLVCTTVVEVGVDVPNATVMMIENAERFGLSQLHQLRGRVGRGSAQSYCILVTDHVTEACRKRMQIMSRTRDGFQIAEADLQLRGPGDFFGERQHGLPPLKAADMVRDMELVQQTEQAAKQILEDDPDLTAQGHQGLRLEVLRLFSKTGENGVVL
jgi:ATP-dependent DNA helicase RecG